MTTCSLGDPGLSRFSFGASFSFAGESFEVDTPSFLPPITFSSPTRSAAPGGREDISLGHLVPPLLLRRGPHLRRTAVHTLERLVHVEATRDELRLTVATVRCQQLWVHRHAPIRVARCLPGRTVFGRRLGRAGFPFAIQLHPALLPAFHIRSPSPDDRNHGAAAHEPSTSRRPQAAAAGERLILPPWNMVISVFASENTRVRVGRRVGNVRGTPNRCPHRQS